MNSFTGSVVSSFKGDGNEAGKILAASSSSMLFLTKKTVEWCLYLFSDVAFDYIESALSKYGDGPFFLGQFSLVSNNVYFLW